MDHPNFLRTTSIRDLGRPSDHILFHYSENTLGIHFASISPSPRFKRHCYPFPPQVYIYHCPSERKYLFFLRPSQVRLRVCFRAKHVCRIGCQRRFVRRKVSVAGDRPCFLRVQRGPGESYRPRAPPSCCAHKPLQDHRRSPQLRCRQSRSLSFSLFLSDPRTFVDLFDLLHFDLIRKLRPLFCLITMNIAGKSWKQEPEFKFSPFGLTRKSF